MPTHNTQAMLQGGDALPGTIRWDQLASPTAALSLTMPATNETTFTVQSTTQRGFTWTSSTLTTGGLATLSLTGTSALATAANNGSVVTFSSTATGWTAATQSLVGIFASGVNVNASVTLTGATISVTNTGTTNTNRALTLTASGAATANVALEITAGAMLSGTTTAPTSGIAAAAGAVILKQADTLELIALKRNGVATGFTTITDTDTYVAIKPRAASGGLQLIGMTSTSSAFLFRGFAAVPATVITNLGVMDFRVGKTDGGTSSANIAAADVGFTFTNDDGSVLAAIMGSGLMKQYGTVATAGWGIPAIYGSTLQRSETAADTNVLTVTPAAAAGHYRLTFLMDVSAANTATLGWTATWTDSNGTAQAPTNLDLIKNGVALPALTFLAVANDTYTGSVDITVNNAAVAIVIKLTFAGTSFTAKVSATIEELA